MSRILALTSLFLALPFLAHAGDWSEYRGPGRHGVNDESGLLSSWAERAPRELWRRPIGIGYSAVSVADGRLYTMETAGEEEAVVCLDAATGETLWQTAIGPSGSSDMQDDGPRATPTVVDGTVYTASSAARLVALSAADGRVLWERDLQEHGAPPRFGYSTSPLVDGDLVLVETGGAAENPGVVAFDRATGEPRWTALEGPAGYSSPIAIDLGGRRQYVFFRRVNAEVVSLDADGGVLWRHPTTGLAIITTPIFLPPDRIFVASADDVFGGLMLRVSAIEDGFEVAEVWSERLMRNHFNTSVVIDGFLYGFDNGTLRCLDATTGEMRWAKRGFGKGSVVASGDLLFVLGDDGTLALVRADSEAFEELGRVQAMTGRSWTAPSLAHGRLYLRDFDELVAYDVSEGAGGSAAVAPAPEVQP